MKKFLSLITMILFIILNIPVSHAETLDIAAPSYMLLDLNSGQVLYEKDSNQKLYPASTTKIMTAILALETGKLDQVMTASKKAIDPGKGGMNIGIMEGEKLTLEDLLHALLIKSANETANIIAENIAGSTEDFVEMMNKKAGEIGAVNTHYVNTNGMHDDNHYTTVSDMAKISLYAMKNKDFKRIVAKSKYDMTPTNKHSKWDTLYTTNKLFYYKSDLFSEITGIKTGYTSKAGHNLVSSAKNKEGVELVAIVFGVKSIASATNVYSLSEKLLEYGFKNFSIQQFAKADEQVKKITVTDAKDDGYLELITSDSLSALLPNDENLHNIEENVKFTMTDVKAPVKKGDIMGYIEYKRQGIPLGKINIIASRNVEKSFKAEVRDDVKAFISSPLLKRIIIGIVITLVSFIILRIVLKKISRASRLRRYRS
ncbi:MAG: D-alanyl-D-alanine carboxypeptidase [Clostridia bacterium]|nr:D-alanyl-D-alanine carboxypeptidase [Clostridia bacterium]